MIVEPNWGAFSAKFNGKEQKTFEWFCSLLFSKRPRRLQFCPAIETCGLRALLVSYRAGSIRRSVLFVNYEAPRFRAAAVSAFPSRTQSMGGFTASDIYMRQSEPPCSRKSAVPRGIFGSLASSNGAQLMELAEVQAVSGSARLCPLSLECGPLVLAPRPRLPSCCNKRCRPRERPRPWTRPRSSPRVGFDS